MQVASFPTYRARRMRASETFSQFVRETEISARDFIYPLFVKAGSIIPMAEPAEYAEQALAGPIHLAVYPGKDATLDYYEDEQDGYGYETGRYSIRHITWNEAEQKLTVEDPVSPAGWQPEAHEFIVEVQ